ncbi:adenosylcobalamin-dependent ribonucleoside-triphosphate reductase [Sphaerisporangium siamense]|uniref:Adenosylcobalamin-dependent ribonucleoside-triphosphate reductase n=1 Tax=Sphaerisporangium siamense TaxID=795645 RepID=A0A7W7GBJ4_9ACTN|nr:ribonucleoside-triphosphate reductase, adenosylcobalamin-dependent [Sphaerisporangium siamense]MBB4702895.1 ribonucleoside-triphosphate reductase [Sphaerisporangium siamense]GII83346.1 adenosylcobalamin-dependent ribonucleoside-triphosphate reductase [Sphaerisporangium siamense]
MTDFTFGPTGQTVYERTYSRTKADGSKETWPETVDRVVLGNLDLVPTKNPEEYVRESAELYDLMSSFAVLPAGRHLWASGVRGRQYLFNCHTSGWTDRFSEHFEFTFLRLMEGGGVGSNYASAYLGQYGPVQHGLRVHIVCDPAHPDYQAMKDVGLLSEEFSHEWDWPLVVEDSREGWADALSDLLDAFMREDTEHEDRVFDVSNVRAAGARLKTFGGTASGPAPLAKMLLDVAAVLGKRVESPVSPLAAMEIDHAIAQCVVAGGNRRSARMAMLPWDDPYIFQFIACKAGGMNHWTTNISVIIDDRFNEVLAGNSPASARANQIWAEHVLAEISKGMLANGEPGIWNKSLSQVGETGEVFATNPCGEIALEPFENCNLGHINLAAFAPDHRGDAFDIEGAIKAARLMTRFLIRATFGDVHDEHQASILAKNRRIGVGLFGVQEALALMGIRYSEAPEWLFPKKLLNWLREAIRDEARKYAFQLRIPEPVKVTTVAPTGSIAKLPGTTEGIHPIFSRYYIRRIRFSTLDESQQATVEDYRARGYNVLPDPQAANTVVVEIPSKESVVERVEAAGWPAEIVESADELTLSQLLSFQEMVQAEYADNAVSFTANIDPTAYTAEKLSRIIRNYSRTLKGTTIFPERGFELAPYERITREQYEEWVTSTGLTNVEDGTDEDCANGACPIR